MEIVLLIVLFYKLKPKTMKKKLMNILENPNDKLIAVDMDGVLCEGDCWSTDSIQEPIPKMIEYVNSLYMKGAHIIIYTARLPGMYEHTFAWLVKHKVLFHGISMGKKCGADLYIDDKALNVEDINH